MQKGLAILRGKGYYIDNFHSRGFAPRENLKFKRVEIMNKSKFLKKSLAMLLALMLVFAMIPLSASAVDELPEVTGVWVNDVQATPNGDKAYSAEIVESTEIEVQVQLNSAKGGKVAYYVDDLKDESKIDVENGRWVFKLTKADVEAGSFSFTTLYQNDGPAETYNVTITTVDAKGDATVADVRLPGQYDSWSNQDENGEIHYTVVAPYSPRVDRNTVVYVKPTDSDASVWLKNGSNVQEQKEVTTGEYAGYYPVPVTGYDKRVEFSVIAQNGEQDNYTVTAVEPIPFASFSMKDERHESQISRVTVDPNFQVESVKSGKVPVVELYVPYDYSGNFTPTFETNYGVKVVTQTGVELKSGETYKWSDLVKTAPDRTKDYTIPVIVKYSDGSQENWTLAFDVRTDGNTEKDTIPAIKSLIVDNFVAEIEGDIITLTIPATVRTANKTLKLDTTSNVSVVGTKLANSDANLEEIKKVDLSKDQYTLRATAAYYEFDAIDKKKAERDYTLNIVTAEMEEPELISMILKSEVTGETLEGRIEGPNVYFDNKEGENAIPYRYKSVLEKDSAADTSMEGDDWKLFWAVSDGNTITYQDKAIATSGSDIGDFAKFLPSGGKRFNNKAGREIAVSNGSSTQGYTVWFQSAEASHDSKLTNEVLVARQDEVKDFADLNNRNSEKATVSDTDKTITASIWYNEWKAYTNEGNSDKTKGPVFVTTLPEGAEAFFVSEGDPKQKDGALNKLDEVNAIDHTVVTTLPTVGYEHNGIKIWNYGMDLSKGDVKADGPLKIVIVSQALAEEVGEGKTYKTLADLKDADNKTKPFYTVYELTLVKREPRTNSTLESLSVYDNYTGTTIDAVKDGNTFTLNLPAYFVDETRKSEDALFLNFTPETGGQKVTAGKANITDVVEPIAWNLDGTLNTKDSDRLVYNVKSKSLTTTKNADIAKLVVTAESGSSKTSEYTVKVNINDANEAGVLNSVTIAGSAATPNGYNVTVNVPFATEVTSLAPEFNTSENAFVLEGTWTLQKLEELAEDYDKKDFIVDEGETFNFLTPRTFTVVSESGKQVNTYTITVVPDETFPDVTTDDWFYDEVMTAANKGWITGDNGYFKPDDTMKRGDFALIIARILNYDPENYPTSGFPDVDSDLYYSAAIAFCKDQGIIGGEGGYFNAEDPITREEMAKILAEALQLTTSIPEKLYADDAEIAQWAKGYVYACQEAGIMEGSGDNFNPRDNATRAEGAAVLVRAFA